MITWTKEFETGSAKLDQQHQMLIAKLNVLGGLLHTTNPSPQEMVFIDDLVEYLESYANVHFADEEECMQQHECPADALNRQEHDRFRAFIREYRRVYEANGFRVEALRTLHADMRAWIMEHILKVDTQLRPCIEKH